LQGGCFLRIYIVILNFLIIFVMKKMNFEQMEVIYGGTTQYAVNEEELAGVDPRMNVSGCVGWGVLTVTLGIGTMLGGSIFGAIATTLAYANYLRACN
jgi:hypothetical protein